MPGAHCTLHPERSFKDVSLSKRFVRDAMRGFAEKSQRKNSSFFPAVRRTQRNVHFRCEKHPEALCVCVCAGRKSVAEWWLRTIQK